MIELTTTNHEHESAQDIAALKLERLLVSSLPRTTLLPLVTERVKLAIARHIDATQGEAIAADAVRRAPAIPLEPELCTLMARVGFDKALFTYGHIDGVAVGFAEGAWLLKFIAPTPNEASGQDRRFNLAATEEAYRASA